MGTYVHEGSSVGQVLSALVENLNDIGQRNEQLRDTTFQTELHELNQNLQSTRNTLQGIEGGVDRLVGILDKALNGDEQALTERLQLKIKAKYLDQRMVLNEFLAWTKTKSPQAVMDNDNLVGVFLDEVGGQLIDDAI